MVTDLANFLDQRHKIYFILRSGAVPKMLDTRYAVILMHGARALTSSFLLAHRLTSILSSSMWALSPLYTRCSCLQRDERSTRPTCSSFSHMARIPTFPESAGDFTRSTLRVRLLSFTLKSYYLHPYKCLGGMVTFTPKAIAEDTARPQSEICHLIRKINKHPFPWRGIMMISHAGAATQALSDHYDLDNSQLPDE